MTPNREVDLAEIERHLERGRQLRALAMGAALRRLTTGIAAALRGVGHGLARRRRRRAALGELRALPPGILKDIGLSPGDIPLLAERYGVTGRPAVRTRFGLLSGGEKIEPAPKDAAALVDAPPDPGHALRTPLTSIRSFSEIVRDNPGLTPAERAAFLGIVIDETLRLEQAIDHVLDDRRAA
jgi:signal transduction histidine kinase